MFSVNNIETRRNIVSAYKGANGTTDLHKVKKMGLESLLSVNSNEENVQINIEGLVKLTASFNKISTSGGDEYNQASQRCAVFKMLEVVTLALHNKINTENSFTLRDQENKKLPDDIEKLLDHACSGNQGALAMGRFLISGKSTELNKINISGYDNYCNNSNNEESINYMRTVGVVKEKLDALRLNLINLVAHVDDYGKGIYKIRNYFGVKLTTSAEKIKDHLHGEIVKSQLIMKKNQTNLAQGNNINEISEKVKLSVRDLRKEYVKTVNVISVMIVAIKQLRSNSDISAQLIGKTNLGGMNQTEKDLLSFLISGDLQFIDDSHSKLLGNHQAEWVALRQNLLMITANYNIAGSKNHSSTAMIAELNTMNSAVASSSSLATVPSVEVTFEQQQLIITNHLDPTYQLINEHAIEASNGYSTWIKLDEHVDKSWLMGTAASQLISDLFTQVTGVTPDVGKSPPLRNQAELEFFINLCAIQIQTVRENKNNVEPELQVLILNRYLEIYRPGEKVESYSDVTNLYALLGITNHDNGEIDIPEDSIVGKLNYGSNTEKGLICMFANIGFEMSEKAMVFFVLHPLISFMLNSTPETYPLSVPEEFLNGAKETCIQKLTSTIEGSQMIQHALAEEKTQVVLNQALDIGVGNNGAGLNFVLLGAFGDVEAARNRGALLNGVSGDNRKD